jgi:hypothetical protein
MPNLFSIEKTNTRRPCPGNLGIITQYPKRPELVGAPVICERSDGMGALWILLTTGGSVSSCGYESAYVRLLDHGEEITLTQVLEVVE